MTKNTGSSIQLLFPPYQAAKSKNNVFKKCGQRYDFFTHKKEKKTWK